MKMKRTIKEKLDKLGKSLIPQGMRADFSRYAASAGMFKPPYYLISLLLFVSLFITMVLFFVSNAISFMDELGIVVIALLVFLFFLVVGSLITAIILGGAYFYLNLKIYKRTKIIEDNMIDYLVLVSTNLKGGLSFEESLWGAIKPEFGILSEEMSLVSKKVMTGSDLSDALMEMTEKYDESPNLKRTINIITGELDSGGRIAYVLDDIIKNLRKTRALKEEMAANTLMFTIFITAIVLFISPVLFSLAFNLLNILISVSQMLGGVGGAEAAGSTLGGGGASSLDFSAIELDPVLFQTFSVVALAIISIFASMIISIIQKGDIKGGIKYLPFFLFTSTVFYWIMMSVMEGFFGFL